MRHGKKIGLCILVLALGLGKGAANAQVVVVVSSSSPVVELSKHQLADIFLGRARRFPDGREAVPIDQEEGLPVRDEFYTRFAGRTASQLKAYWSKIIFTGRGEPPKAAPNSSEVKRWIAENPNAIGYIELAEVDSRVRVLSLK